MYIPIILGTAREGRESEKVANFVLAEAKSFGFESEIFDPRNFLKSAITWQVKESPEIKMMGEKIKSAEGIIIVSPEYNHGYPGELKMFLDNFYSEYFGKPLGICGVSSGILGGARMAEQIRQVSIELHLLPIREAVYFGTVGSLFDKATGEIIDSQYKDRLKKMFEEIKSYAEKLSS